MARNSLKNVFNLIQQAKEELPPEQLFINDLKRSIELNASKNKRKPSQYYKPSSMQCIRNMYYQRVGKDPDNTEPSYIMEGICNSGSDIHVRIQQSVESMHDNAMDCEYVDVANFIKQRKIKNIKVVDKQGMETKLLHTTLNMSFLCDGIIKYHNHYYILEIKTETVNKWYSREGVDTSHINQATAYSIAFGLDEVIFVYINRDMLDMKVFLLKVDDDMKQNLVGKIEECDSYVKKFITPPKPQDISRRTCEYCPYKQSCRKDS